MSKILMLSLLFVFGVNLSQSNYQMKNVMFDNDDENW
jgi:hypothetical protein